MPAVARALDGVPLYAVAFGVTLATSVVGMTVAGGWCDARGPAAPLWSGMACFVAGLLLAGFAPSMPVFLAGRLVQGLGAGGMSVALYVLVGRRYPEALRRRIFAAFATAWVVPALVGPALSGLVVGERRPGRDIARPAGRSNRRAPSRRRSTRARRAAGR